MKQRRHSAQARIFGWRLLGIIVGVIILAGLLVVVTGWVWNSDFSLF